MHVENDCRNSALMAQPFKNNKATKLEIFIHSYRNHDLLPQAITRLRSELSPHAVGCYADSCFLYLRQQQTLTRQ